MNKLKENFEKLKGEYSRLETDGKRKKELLESMKEIVTEMNGGEDEYVYKKIDEGEKVSIKDCSKPSDLYAIVGDMSHDVSSQKKDAIGERERKRQTGYNTYGPNNEYFGK